MSNVYTIEKKSQNFNFLGNKIWRNALALKSRKVQGIFGETFILALLSSILFCSGGKRHFLGFLRKLGWFHNRNELFPIILAKN